MKDTPPPVQNLIRERNQATSERSGMHSCGFRLIHYEFLPVYS